MKRSDLEHVLRAAGAITNQRDFIVIGSQSILGQFPDAPAALLVSDEVDLYPRDRPDLADLIDGAIGELVERATLLERVAALPVDDARREAIRVLVISDFAGTTG
jgi:hypothetical protein